MNATAMTTSAQQPEADFAVIGLGASGRSCLRYLHRSGAAVVAFDTRTVAPGMDELRRLYPALEIVTGTLDEERLARCATIVVSPGVPLDQPALRALAQQGKAAIGDVELFARQARAPIVAITGTNGKSTVTTLVADMLEAAGKTVRRGGNLGTPALDLLDEPEPDCYVLELSSFQLELTTSLAPRVAAVLNITPDHLDRHGSFERYAAAKGRILARAEHAVLNADDAHVRALTTSTRRSEFSLGTPGPDRYGLLEIAGETWLAGPDGALLATRELVIAGRHNLANALAAVAIARACGAATAPLIETLRRFRGLPHRAEQVAVIDGRIFINDSKATNAGAAIAAIEGLLGPAGGVVIAGGEPKGTGFAEFAECIVRHAHTAILIGRAAPEIAESIGGRVPATFAMDMRAAVQAAAAAARPGETVLLAPACASFDMFDDYAHRGDAFRAAVLELGGG
ncbi:MAG: UDP-N-acetylmuramoyl-L-alanine--D-glutamate ligase [Gammaproteobacteria bacterium]